MATTTTKHTHPMVFGRRVAGCPRCAELDAGAKPIQWSGARRAALDAQFAREVRAHNCAERGCGPVCTFGDW